MNNKLAGVCAVFCLAVIIFGNILLCYFEYTEKKAVAVQNFKEGSLIVLMYHQVSTNPNALGKYVISPKEFESDLEYIEKNGYTIVTVKQIIDYYENNTPLPSKAVLLTFDDGYETLNAYIEPILTEHNASVVVSVIGKYTDLYSANVARSLSYSHLSWTQIKDMLANNIIELGNHTYELHTCESGKRTGIQKLDSETSDEYKKLLENDVLAFNDEIEQELGFRPTVFAYPFGCCSSESEEILKEFGFKVILTCEEKVNYPDNSDYKKGDLIKLYRFNRPHGKNISNILRG